MLRSRIKHVVLLLAACLMVLTPSAVVAAQLTNQVQNPSWKWSYPSIQGHDLNAVAFGDGRFVAVGDGGSVVTSTDGEHWENPTSAPNHLYDVAFGAGRYVAVGKRVIYTSADGVEWQAFSTPDERPWLKVEFAEGAFWAMSWDGRVYRSADGLSWTDLPMPAEWAPDISESRAFAVGGGSVIVAGGGRDSWFRDRQGRWQPASQGYWWAHAAIWNGDHFLAGGGSGDVYTSPDGDTWTRQSVRLAGHSPNAYVRVLAKLNGWILAVVSEPWTANSRVYASLDGQSWALWTELPRIAVNDIAYGEGVYVAVGNLGAILASRDGRSWAPESEKAEWTFDRVTFCDGFFVAVGMPIATDPDLPVTEREGLIVTSTDGGQWKRHSVKTPFPLQGVACGNGRLVAVGGDWWRVENPRVSGTGLGTAVTVTSDDGLEWTPQVLDGVPYPLNDVAFGSGRFVALSGIKDGDMFTWMRPSSVLLTSVDGVNWTHLEGVADSVPARRVAYVNNRFFILGTGGVYLTSPDGLHWSRHETGFDADGTGIAYGHGRYIMTTTWGLMLHSADGLSWEAGPQMDGWYTDVAFGNGIFLATGYDWYGTSIPMLPDPKGHMIYSADGTNWEVVPPALHQEPVSVAYGNDQFIVVAAEYYAVRIERAGMRCIFPDVPASDPACQEVQQFVSQGVMGGYPDGTFRPVNPVTRGEFAKLLVTALHLQPQPERSAGFADVAGHWAASEGYIQPLVQMGIMNGYPDGRFQPDQPVSRAEAVKMIAMAAGLTAGGAAPYSDVHPAAWYGGWVGEAAARGLIGARAKTPLWSGDRFEADSPVTRREMAILLGNLVDVRQLLQ